jgi:lipid A 3-O-deacylase
MLSSRRQPRILLIAMVALASWHAAPLAAQAVESVRLEVDNDNFNFWSPVDDRGDHEYTHGARLEVDTRHVLPWSARVVGPAPACADEPGPGTPAVVCAYTTWRLTQRIYTPRTNSRELVANERPHSGWLAVSATAHARRPSRLRSVRTELGVTGSPSLAEFSQRVIHRIGQFWEPLGWDNQLGFEPGLLVEYEDQVRRAYGGDAWSTDVVARAVGSLGNVRTGAEAGVMLRAGYHLPHPWLPRANDPERIALAVFVGGAGDLVLHDMSLDGTLFRPSHHVSKLPLVGWYDFGAEVRYHGTAIGFSVRSRGREYRTEPGGHRFSTISVAHTPAASPPPKPRQPSR